MVHAVRGKARPAVLPATAGACDQLRGVDGAGAGVGEGVRAGQWSKAVRGSCGEDDADILPDDGGAGHT